MIRVEVRNRRSRELLDSADFKAADITGEWFSASARFCRIAAELGDDYSLGRVRTVFRGLCSEYRELVGEERLALVLNDPFEQADNHIQGRSICARSMPSRQASPDSQSSTNLCSS